MLDPPQTQLRGIPMTCNDMVFGFLGEREKKTDFSHHSHEWPNEGSSHPPKNVGIIKMATTFLLKAK